MIEMAKVELELIDYDTAMISNRTLITADIQAPSKGDAESYFSGRFGVRGKAIEYVGDDTFTVQGER